MTEPKNWWPIYWSGNAAKPTAWTKMLAFKNYRKRLDQSANSQRNQWKMKTEGKLLMCRVKRTFCLQKSEQEKWKVKHVPGHQSEPHKAVCPRKWCKIRRRHWGIIASSSLPLSNPCPPQARLQCFVQMLVLYTEHQGPLHPSQTANAVMTPETQWYQIV